MFDLKKPCVHCPFKRGVRSSYAFTKERLEQIFNGDSFQCHKTFDRKAQQCAGLMSLLALESYDNQIMQVAHRLGEIDRDDLINDQSYESFDEVFKAYNCEVPA